MPIRFIIATAILSVAACAVDPATATTDQSSMSCDFHFYRCLPGHPGADTTCNIACGNPSHCQDYSPGEYVWCEIHPGQCRFGFRCCDPEGNPAWDMYCTAGGEP